MKTLEIAACTLSVSIIQETVILKIIQQLFPLLNLSLVQHQRPLHKDLYLDV